jgi:P27 family predicted phage terminase small subunit
MPRGGHNKKSVAEKTRNGNPGGRPLPTVVDVPGHVEKAEDLPPPEHLDQDAWEWWTETAPLLVGFVDRIDTSCMVIAAEAWSELRRCQRVTKSMGMFGTGSRGQMRVGPWITAQEKARATYIACTDRLGLNPQARARIGVTIMAGRSMYEMLERDLGGDDGYVYDGECVLPGEGDLPGLPGLPGAEVAA